MLYNDEFDHSAPTPPKGETPSSNVTPTLNNLITHLVAVSNDTTLPDSEKLSVFNKVLAVLVGEGEAKKEEDTYKLVSSTGVSDLNRTVNSLIREGWVTSGGVVSRQSPNGYLQVMVRPLTEDTVCVVKE